MRYGGNDLGAVLRALGVSGASLHQFLKQQGGMKAVEVMRVKLLEAKTSG